MCPMHNVQLVRKKWQSVLSKGSYLNEYMILVEMLYLFRDITSVLRLEVQRGRNIFLSASNAIMDAIPRNLANKLPIILHYKSALTHDLLDDVLMSLCKSQRSLFSSMQV